MKVRVSLTQTCWLISMEDMSYITCEMLILNSLDRLEQCLDVVANSDRNVVRHDGRICPEVLSLPTAICMSGFLVK